MRNDKDEQEGETQTTKRLLYDGSFKFVSGVIGLLLTVLWWGITHQLSSVETQLQNLYDTTQQLRAELSQNYATQLQARVQIDSNSKRIDKLEVIAERLQDKVARLEVVDGYHNNRK